jgi:hypothetical protein
VVPDEKYILYTVVSMGTFCNYPGLQYIKTRCLFGGLRLFSSFNTSFISKIDEN